MTQQFIKAAQAAELLGIRVGYLRKLCHLHQIPYYKPFGKMLYFKEEEILELINKAKVATSEEIESHAQEIEKSL